MNRKGLGIVEVLIAIGITSVVAAGLMTLMGTQSRETRSLAEKLGAMDVQQLMTAALNDGMVCKYVMNNPAVLTFNTTSLPQTITLTGANQKIYASAVETSPGPPPTFALGPVVAEVDPLKPASSVVPSLFISSISLVIKAGSGTSYSGEWTIEFDSSKLVRPLKPVTVQTTITANVTAPYGPTNAQIVGCQGGGGGGAAAAADGPQGSWCGWGMNYFNFWGAASINGNYNALAIVALCKGHDPRVSCPPGYSSLTMCYEADLYHNCNRMLTCLKD